jgi:hypothetical protein
MANKLAVGIIGIVLLLTLSGFVSAYGPSYNYYDGWGYRGDYDRYSYSSVRENNWGAKYIDYDKVKESKYVGQGGWQTTTYYKKTVTEYPRQNCYYGGYYGGNWYNTYPKYYSYGW